MFEIFFFLPVHLPPSLPLYCLYSSTRGRLQSQTAHFKTALEKMCLHDTIFPLTKIPNYQDTLKWT